MRLFLHHAAVLWNNRASVFKRTINLAPPFFRTTPNKEDGRIRE
jgi:hypothetical protein